MTEFTHLNLYERQRIEKYLRAKRSRRFIASKLDRSVSSISDEINGNSVRGIYTAQKADFRAYQKRWRSKTECMKVAMDSELKRFVIDSMEKDHQSPAGISGRLQKVKKDIQYASTKAIYKFVKSPNGRQIERYLYSKAVHKKSGRKRNTPVTIDGRVLIDQRPKMVEEILYGLPIKSFTVDNDISFQKHEALSTLIDASVFFCHPQCPHEKGTIENRNKAIRRYVKKKSDLSKYPLEYFQEVERKLRDRFMTCLNYKTPREAFAQEFQKQKRPLVRGMITKKLLVN